MAAETAQVNTRSAQAEARRRKVLARGGDRLRTIVSGNASAAAPALAARPEAAAPAPAARPEASGSLNRTHSFVPELYRVYLLVRAVRCLSMHTASLKGMLCPAGDDAAVPTGHPETNVPRAEHLDRGIDARREQAVQQVSVPEAAPIEQHAPARDIAAQGTEQVHGAASSAAQQQPRLASSRVEQWGQYAGTPGSSSLPRRPAHGPATAAQVL